MYIVDMFEALCEYWSGEVYFLFLDFMKHSHITRTKLYSMNVNKYEDMKSLSSVDVVSIPYTRSIEKVVCGKTSILKISDIAQVRFH